MARNNRRPNLQKKAISTQDNAAQVDQVVLATDRVLAAPTHDEPSPPWSIATKSIVAVAVLALTVVVIWRFQSLLTPLVLATMLAYLLNPPISWLADRFKGNRGLATLLVYLLLLILFLGASTAIGFVAVEQISRLVALFDSAPELIVRLQARVESLTSQTITFGPLKLALSSIINWTMLQTLAQQATSLIRPVFSTSGNFITSLFGATVNTVSNLALIFIISLYLAKDSRQIGNRLVEIAGQSGYRADTERLLRDFTRIWDAYLRGQVILGLVIFLVVWFSLALLGVHAFTRGLVGEVRFGALIARAVLASSGRRLAAPRPRDLKDHGGDEWVVLHRAEIVRSGVSESNDLSFGDAAALLVAERQHAAPTMERDAHHQGVYPAVVLEHDAVDDG